MSQFSYVRRFESPFLGQSLLLIRLLQKHNLKGRQK